MTVTLRAFAKVNLDLRVLGVRPDGYHELRTVFQSLALADHVTVEARRGAFAITCDAPAVPTDRRNLVWQAAMLLWRAAGLGRGGPRDVAVHLTKRIPAEAGLGGGSANAAAALLALNRLWRTGADLPALGRLAARLGADVPFFLVGGTALGLGRGDDLYPLPDLPRAYVVVVRPGFGVRTADAYRWFDADRRSRRRRARAGTRPSGWPVWASAPGNDFEAPVAARHPAIGRIRRLLIGAGASMAAMSGSGSAVFGLFDRRERAAAAARELARPGWLVVATRTLTRAEFRRLGGGHRL